MLLETSFVQILLETNLVLGIALVLVGIFISLLSVPIAKIFRGSEGVKPNDKIVLFFKIVALIILVIALVMIPISVMPTD